MAEGWQAGAASTIGPLPSRIVADVAPLCAERLRIVSLPRREACPLPFRVTDLLRVGSQLESDIRCGHRSRRLQRENAGGFALDTWLHPPVRSLGKASPGKRVSRKNLALVQLGGLEPPTSCSTDRRSNQLSYNCIARAGPKKGSRMGGKLGATPAFGKAARHPIVVVSKALRRSPPQQKARARRPGFSQRTRPGDQAAGL
jgi:hypothetical protein